MSADVAGSQPSGRSRGQQSSSGRRGCERRRDGERSRTGSGAYPLDRRTITSTRRRPAPRVVATGCGWDVVAQQPSAAGQPTHRVASSAAIGSPARLPESSPARELREARVVVRGGATAELAAAEQEVVDGV